MLYRYYSFRSSYGQAKIVCFCLPFFSSLLFCMYVCVYPVCFVLHACVGILLVFSISFTILFCNALLFLLFWMEWEITSCVFCVCKYHFVTRQNNPNLFCLVFIEKDNKMFLFFLETVQRAVTFLNDNSALLVLTDIGNQKA